jgi:hypothetical protein
MNEISTTIQRYRATDNTRCEIWLQLSPIPEAAAFEPGAGGQIVSTPFGFEVPSCV